MIPKNLRSQDNQENSADVNLDTPQQNSTQTKLTVGKTQVLSSTTAASPSSLFVFQNIFSTPPSTTHISTVVPVLPAVTFIPVNMANRYAPLQLAANPGAIPQDYQSKITYFDGTGTYTSQQHTKKMTDYFENYEIDADDVRMKIFVQSLTGDVRTWFRALPINTIADPDSFYQTFLNRWEKKKDPLHILSEYESLKRGPEETV